MNELTEYKAELTELSGKQKEFIEEYRNTPLGSIVCEKVGMEYREYLRLLETDKNFAGWIQLAEREFRDKIELRIMKRAGLLGDEEFKNSKKGMTKELLAMIRAKDSRFGDRVLNGEKRQNNTQINANKVIITYERTKED